MSPAEALALLRTTEREAVGKAAGFTGGKRRSVYSRPMGWMLRPQKTSREDTEAHWSLSVLWRTRGPVCEVKLGVESLSITVAAYVWDWAQKVPGLAMLTLEVPYMLSTAPFDPQPHSSCRQRPPVCAVLCTWYRLAPIGPLAGE